MKILFASDLHLEFPANREFLEATPLKPGGDILILAGDIVPIRDLEMYQDFFDYISGNFALTWWLPGNHEYYRSDIRDRGVILNEKIRDNITLVNNVSVSREGIRFIFSTLWTRVSQSHQFEIQFGYADFRLIRNNGRLISIDDYNSFHQTCLAFLTDELKREFAGTTVVITHHMPAFPEGKKAVTVHTMSELFVADLHELIEETSPDYWIYGHDHTNKVDFSIGSTRLRTNQLGYIMYNEQKGFDTGKFIII